MKLWDKGDKIEKRIEDFTVGNDRDWDRFLAPYDVIGSMAHGAMLQQVGLLSKEEWEALSPALKEIYMQTLESDFVVKEDFEDIHSQVEFELTKAVGIAGKKIHTGRSRNDQVLVDLKMFLRDEIKDLVGLTKTIFATLLTLSDQHKQVIIPGYTHLQVAMPSSIGLWLSAYAETLIDDLRILQAAFQQVNQNPLGSAAGYGSSFPIDRQLTTRLLGFETLHFNVVAAQMARGKTENMMGYVLASFGATLGKLAMDICLYNSQNFGFLTFPAHLTTGSSIMPHKKNPDVFELVRGKCNHLQSIPGQLTSLLSNLPSGYHRDLQILKDILFPSLTTLKDCLAISDYMLQHMEVNKQSGQDEKYDDMYSVEAVNSEVKKGLPFREAYQKVGADMADGNYVPDKELRHTHQGSIGNLCLDEIENKMKKVLDCFDFESYQKAIDKLIG